MVRELHPYSFALKDENPIFQSYKINNKTCRIFRSMTYSPTWPMAKT